MSYELKPNTFSAFVNDKNGNEKRPDWTGKINIDGEEMKIAIWKKVGKTGVAYLSGTVEKTEKPAETSATTEPVKELLDDQQIPF